MYWITLYSTNRWECCDVIETLCECFPLSDHWNINHNMWPHTRKHHCFIEYTVRYFLPKMSRQKNYSKGTCFNSISMCSIYSQVLPMEQYHFCQGWHHGWGFQTNGNCSLFILQIHVSSESWSPGRVCFVVLVLCLRVNPSVIEIHNRHTATATNLYLSIVN